MADGATRQERRRRGWFLIALPVFLVVGGLVGAALLQESPPARFSGAEGISTDAGEGEPMWWLDPVIITPPPSDPDTPAARPEAPPTIQVLVPGDALFESGSHDIVPESLAALDEALSDIDPAAVTSGNIRCHTDDVGSDAHNLDLSIRRAESLLAALAEGGLNVTVIVATGVGEAEPKFSNSTDTGQARNRRCEIELALQP